MKDFNGNYAGAPLTDRQCAVYQLLAQGKPNKVIARELGIGETSVKTHVTGIFIRLGVSNRVQAAILA